MQVSVKDYFSQNSRCDYHSQLNIILQHQIIHHQLLKLKQVKIYKYIYMYNVHACHNSIHVLLDSLT